MKRIAETLLMVLLLYSGMMAQKPIRVKTTYTYEGNSNESPAEAEEIALLRAKIQAIEETFVTTVSESASSINSTQLDEDFFSSYSNSSLKGEWIETIDGYPKFKYEFNDRRPIVTCTIEGYVKEITGIRTEFEAVTLKNSPNIRFTSNEFSDGDDMFLYFKSPIGGYLNIFLLCLDDDTALCLLPYKESKDGTYRVEADKEYFFFSKEKANNLHELVDEYTLTAERPVEVNEVVIIFSPDKFNKVSLNLKEEDLTAIKETSIGKFNKWLAKLQAKYNDITLNKISIKITSI
ncbi:MAG: hypothetical protein K2K25_06095 [Muribaculaceae bacterium]|nr:hypothetical protein [Muribaculaceae bacterium]